MRKLAAVALTLTAIAFATSAFATQYPPGPGAAFPDTLTIFELQNPAAVPHPVNPDTVHGIPGIITGFDPKPSGYALYIQDATGNPWTGIDVFTGATPKHSPPFSFQLGDQVVVYGKMQEFGGESEIEGLDTNQNTDDCFVRKVGSTALPPFYNGAVSDLYELPTNTAAEQWEGMLVKVTATLKVARTSLTGGMGTNNSFLLVDQATAMTESLFVDGNTLTTYAPPAVGQQVDWVQGIYNQRARGYRIQLRDGNDVNVATPPNVSDAYPLSATTVRVKFDRDVTTASATNTANYSFASGASVSGAVMDGQSAAIVTISTALSPGDPEAVTVSGIVGLANGLTMATGQTRNFRNGIVTVQQIQGPNPDSLVAATGCADNGNWLANNNGATARFSVRGVCSGIQGSLYTLVDAAGGARSGIAVFAPITALVRGRQYLVSGALQEFPSVKSGETEVVGTVNIVDEGLAAEPAPVSITVAQVRDTTCDPAEAIYNGEDVEGCIAELSYGKIVADNPPSPAFVAGDNFRIVDINSPADTFFVANNITRTYLPVVDNVVSVTGIVQFSFGAFRIQPRGNEDIRDHGAITDVPGGRPSKVQFAVAPNPATTANVTFGLPVSNRVELGVYDVSGRLVNTLAHGTFPAGTFSRTWNGLDASGKPAGAGMYFYRLRVGTELYTVRGIKLN